MNENTLYEKNIVWFQHPHVLNIQYAYIKMENGLLKCDDGLYNRWIYYRITVIIIISRI